MVSATSTAARAATYVPATMRRRRVEAPVARPAADVRRLAAGRALATCPRTSRELGAIVSGDEEGLGDARRAGSDQASSGTAAGPGRGRRGSAPRRARSAPRSSNPPSASSVARIRSARSATSLAGTWTPRRLGRRCRGRGGRACRRRAWRDPCAGATAVAGAVERGSRRDLGRPVAQQVVAGAGEARDADRRPPAAPARPHRRSSAQPRGVRRPSPSATSAVDRRLDRREHRRRVVARTSSGRSPRRVRPDRRARRGRRASRRRRPGPPAPGPRPTSRDRSPPVAEPGGHRAHAPPAARRARAGTRRRRPRSSPRAAPSRRRRARGRRTASPSRAAAASRDDRPEPVAREHDRSASSQQPRALGDRDDVVGQRRRGRSPSVGRVGQARARAGPATTAGAATASRRATGAQTTRAGAARARAATPGAGRDRLRPAPVVEVEPHVAAATTTNPPARRPDPGRAPSPGPAPRLVRARPRARRSSRLGYGRHGEAPPRLPHRATRPRAPATCGSSGSSIARSPASRSRSARALDEVAIVIDDEPTPEQLRENGLGPDETLYGLYEGVPRIGVGRRLGPDARTGSCCSACRSRRTSPTRTTSPTRSGSRSSTSSPTTWASRTRTASPSSASTDPLASASQRQQPPTSASSATTRASPARASATAAQARRPSTGGQQPDLERRACSAVSARTRAPRRARRSASARKHQRPDANDRPRRSGIDQRRAGKRRQPQSERTDDRGSRCRAPSASRPNSSWLRRREQRDDDRRAVGRSRTSRTDRRDRLERRRPRPGRRRRHVHERMPTTTPATSDPTPTARSARPRAAPTSTTRVDERRTPSSG